VAERVESGDEFSRCAICKLSCEPMNAAVLAFLFLQGSSAEVEHDDPEALKRARE